VDLTATNPGLLVPHIQARRLWPLLATSAHRSPLLPDAPKAAEAERWRAVIQRAGTRPD
jgi:tripartite-type tricarboxylate transporter receptor subunit TctC